MASWPPLSHKKFKCGKHTNVYRSIDNAHSYYHDTTNSYYHDTTNSYYRYCDGTYSIIMIIDLSLLSHSSRCSYVISVVKFQLRS